jgi:hypothetical protein
MSTQEFIFSEYPEIEFTSSVVEQQDAQEEIGYFDNIDLPLYMQDNEEYVSRIMRLLPRDWVISFRAYEGLEFYDIEDYISRVYYQLDKETIRTILEISIMASHPETESYESGTPYAVLLTLYHKRPEFIRSIAKEIYKSNKSIIPGRLQEIVNKMHKIEFDGKVYKLTCSDKCIDSVRILSLFCNEPAKKIQHAWLKYRNKKYNQSAQIIQQKVLEWLYRPGGPIMKRAELHFYSCILRLYKAN